MRNNITIVRGKVKSFASEFNVKATDTPEDEKDLRIEGWASKPVVDRYREVVDLEAFASTIPQFMENPVMLHHHYLPDVIGLWDEFSITPEGVKVAGNIFHGWALADEVQMKVRKKALRGLSIGFRELDGYYDEEEDVYHITKLELIEISVVSVPACQPALFVMKNGKCAEVILVEEGVDVQELEEQLMAQHADRREKTASEDNQPTLTQVVQTLSDAIESLKTEVKALDDKITEQASATKSLQESLDGYTTVAERLDSIASDVDTIKQAQEESHKNYEDIEDRLNDTELCAVDLMEIVESQISAGQADNRE